MLPLIDLKEASRLLGISIWSVRKLVRNGELTPVRLHRRVVLEPAELERYVAACRQPRRME